MVTLMRRSLIAFLVGALLVLAVPIALALVAAAPGLRTLIQSIRAVDLPLPPVFFLLSTLLPALSLSFCVGLGLFRVVGGRRGQLLVASSAPWILSALYLYADVCAGTSGFCLSVYELSGALIVPLGLLLAAWISKPPSINRSVVTDLQQQEAAPPHVLQSGHL